MKRSILITALLLVGCSGPKNTDPKPVNVKDDPRIQRAGGGAPGEGATRQPQGQLPRPGGKGAE